MDGDKMKREKIRFARYVKHTCTQDDFDKEYYADLEDAFAILTCCTDLFIDSCGLQKE